MAQELTNIVLAVDSRQVRTAQNDLSGLARQGTETKRATDGLSSSFVALKAVLVAVATAYPIAKLLETTRSFDKLNAGLITATGSAEGAKVAFGAIQQFAASTPYDLQQVTDSFTKLVNYGLTPSERALTSYGNTASSLGKDLNQMIEAVADAATGEFERLKEFGIKSSKEGDRVKFTFRGMTTEIANNAKEIQSYLIRLGEDNFAGAMANRMNSLDGEISNLNDSIDVLFLSISQAGAGDVFRSWVRTAIMAVQELTSMIASGQIEGYLDAMNLKFRSWANDISYTIEFLSLNFSTELDGIKGTTDDTINFILGAFRNMPENIRAYTQILVVEFFSRFDIMSAYAKSFVDKIKAIFTSKTFAEVDSALSEQIKGLTGAREDSIVAILAERDTAIQSADAQINKANDLRKVYDESQKARLDVTGDRLSQFGIPSPEVVATMSDEALAALEQARMKQYAQDLEWFEAEVQRDKEMYDAKIAARAEYHERLYNLETGSVEASYKFSQSIRDMDLMGAIRHGALMLSNVAKTNRVMFGIQKAFALANAAVSLPAAVLESYRNGGGYPWGIIPAGLMLAEGLSQIKAITSASFGGGVNATIGGRGSTSPAAPAGALPPGATALPSGNELPTQAPVRELRITVESDGPHSQGMRQFARDLSETLADMGGNINLVVN